MRLDEFIAEESEGNAMFERSYQAADEREKLLEALITARKAENLTQRDVAQLMDTTQSAVSEIESGETDPYLSTLQRYAAAVNHKIELHLSTLTGTTGKKSGPTRHDPCLDAFSAISRRTLPSLSEMPNSIPSVKIKPPRWSVRTPQLRKVDEPAA